MKIADLNEVNRLYELLRRVQASYHNNFNNKKNRLRLTISLDNGHNPDSTPMDVLGLDLTLDGAIAALTGQAYRKKIEELKKRLQELGVDHGEKEVW